MRLGFGAASAVISAVLAGCVAVAPTPGTAPGTPSAPVPAGSDAAVPDRIPISDARANFAAVVRRVEPVAERVCRAEAASGTPCDIEIVVVTDPRAEPNAFQTRDRAGRPVVGFTLSLIADARNQDEIAFIMGHEAAHHIAGHIDVAAGRAREGGLLGAVVASAAGLDPAQVERVARVSAGVNARRYQKGFELEADRLGTRIAALAGYDPVRGALFFQRIPDPGDRFLGTHPPNADRLATVRAAAAGL